MDRDEAWSKLWGELRVPGVLHFLKTSSKTKMEMSKSVYEAETPGGEVYKHTCACAYDRFLSVR